MKLSHFYLFLCLGLFTTSTIHPSASSSTAATSDQSRGMWLPRIASAAFATVGMITYLATKDYSKRFSVEEIMDRGDRLKKINTLSDDPTIRPALHNIASRKCRDFMPALIQYRKEQILRDHIREEDKLKLSQSPNLCLKYHDEKGERDIIIPYASLGDAIEQGLMFSELPLQVPAHDTSKPTIHIKGAPDIFVPLPVGFYYPHDFSLTKPSFVQQYKSYHMAKEKFFDEKINPKKSILSKVKDFLGL
jgi:hypothetical protein